MEGYTGGEFDTYVLIQNPGENAANVTMFFQLPEGGSVEPHSFELKANSRQTVMLDSIPGLESAEVSTWICAGMPVVACAVYGIHWWKQDKDLKAKIG